MENLRYIIQKSGARIVLSSDWRRTKEARNEAGPGARPAPRTPAPPPP